MNLTRDMPEQKLPESYSPGEELNWEAKSQPVTVFTELPFWIMTANGSIRALVKNHEFKVHIADNFAEVHLDETTDSCSNCVYIGSNPSDLHPKTIELLKTNEHLLLPRKCKTVIRINSECNEDVLSAQQDEKRRHVSDAYLRAFCEAHVEVVNSVLRSYRLLTYDFFPYEVSPWDVPIWFVQTKEMGSFRIKLLDYAGWDRKPAIVELDGSVERYQLISLSDLESGLYIQAAAGELELLDAINLMERGNYSDAVRRITTAIEAMTEFVLRQELLKRFSEAEVDKKLNASKMSFPRRLKEYQNLSGRVMPEPLQRDLETTRALRHRIVHNAYRVVANERGRAQRSVDTGRWIYNWLEDDANRKSTRERKLGMRSLGRFFPLFYAEITADGVQVQKPRFT
jgi:hypothetical protein